MAGFKVAGFSRQLIADWQAEVERFANRGQEPSARLMESMIRDVEERLIRWEDEELTLQEAACEAGMAYSTIQQKVASGAILNAGEKGRPRVRRADLIRAASRWDGRCEVKRAYGRPAER